MNSFRKGRYNLIILLVYLVTSQVSTGNFLFSAGRSYAESGITCFRQTPVKPFPKLRVGLRKHLNVSYNVKNLNFTESILSSFSLSDIKVFESPVITNQLTPNALVAYGKLNGRAPPGFS